MRENNSFENCLFVEEGKYVPLLNDPTLMTSDFLAKLKRATSLKASSPKLNPKSIKPSNQLRRPRSLRSLIIVASLIKKTDH